MTTSSHGFQYSQGVYYPRPLGRSIGLCARQPDRGIALVKKDPSIAFTNIGYFEALLAKRLTPRFNHAELRLCRSQRIGKSNRISRLRSERSRREEWKLWESCCRPRWMSGSNYQMGRPIGFYAFTPALLTGMKALKNVGINFSQRNRKEDDDL